MLTPVEDLDPAIRDYWPHSQTVDKPWGHLEPMLNWCKCQLEHEWRWQLLVSSDGNLPGRYIFYFQSDKDHTAFMLKWC